MKRAVLLFLVAIASLVVGSSVMASRVCLECQAPIIGFGSDATSAESDCYLQNCRNACVDGCSTPNEGGMECGPGYYSGIGDLWVPRVTVPATLTQATPLASN